VQDPLQLRPQPGRWHPLRRDASQRPGPWASRGEGIVWRFDPTAGDLEEVGQLPTAAGRLFRTQASAWALDCRTGMLYGGTTPEGFLFRLNPESGEIIGLGKPIRLDEITCLTVAKDGRVFGACGAAEDIGHIFCHDPAVGSLWDLGVAVSTLAARQYGYHFRCMLTGAGGEIYLGQHERVNPLWAYFPAV